MTESSDFSAADARRRRLFAYASDHGYTRDERLDLAEFVLHRDIETWKDLTDIDICRLLDHFQGYEYINHQKLIRP